MSKTRAVQVDRDKLKKLRIFVASQNEGSTYGFLSKAVGVAIDEYVDRREKEIEELAERACEYNGL